MAKYDPDKACEQAIAESAVEVRQWTSSNADAVISTNYYLQIGERFYGAGAPQVWLHGLEEGLETDNPEESLTLVDGMIVQLPEDEAKRQEVVRVFREEAEEFEVEELRRISASALCISIPWNNCASHCDVSGSSSVV